MKDKLNATSIECIALYSSVHQLTALCEAIFEELCLECNIIERIIDETIKMDFGCLEIPAQLEKFERKGVLRLVGNCSDTYGNNFEGFYMAGFDNRLKREYELTAYISILNKENIKRAIFNLVLNPFLSGQIRDNDLINIDIIHYEVLKHRLLYSFPKSFENISGRIIWIDANPHIDTLIDSYGLSILNKIAREKGFFGVIISPYSDFETPQISVTQLIEHFAPDLIGISFRNIDDVVSVRTLEGIEEEIDTSNYLSEVKLLIDSICSIYSKPIIVGGAALTKSPIEIMRELNVKYGVRGPGDYIIERLLNEWIPTNKEEENLEHFNAIWIKIQGTITLTNQYTSSLSVNGKIQLPKPISAVPRDPVKIWHEKRLGIPSAIRGTYGCPLNCNYCLEAVPKIKISQSAASLIVDEMEWMMSQYNVNNFHLTDSEINLPFSRLLSIAEEINKRFLGNKISWVVYSTPFPFEIEALPQLVDAGLKGLKISVDHFYPRQLKNLGRVHKEESIHRLFNALKNYTNRIEVTASILFGAPGENVESINYTIENIKHYIKLGFNFYYSVGIRLYPGTPMFNEWENSNLSLNDCYGPGEENNGLSPLFYCTPESPRIFMRRLFKEFYGNNNVRSIEAGRPPKVDYMLRLISIAYACFIRGEKKQFEFIIDKIDKNINNQIDKIGSLMKHEEKVRSVSYIH